MKYRGSLFLAILLVTLTAVSAVGTATVFFAVREYQSLYLSAATDDLNALSENLSSDLIPILAGGPDLFEATNVLLRLEQYEAVKYALITTPENEILTQYVGQAVVDREVVSPDALKKTSQALIAQAAANVLDVASSDGTLLARKQIGDDRLPQGFLIIVTDVATPLGQSTQRLLSNALPMVLLALIIVIAVTVYLLTQLLRPLRNLTGFTQEIRSSGDYSLRAEVRGSREIADLTVSFNKMMGDIYKEMEKNRLQYQQLSVQRAQMEQLANFDALTGLANRKFIIESLRRELAMAKRHKKDLAVLYLDVDGFKHVNDSFGHEVGDKLLEEIGVVLKSTLRESDLVARLGGDEFLIVLDHSTPPSVELAGKMADRLIGEVSRSRKIDGWSVRVGASIGIAMAADADYELSDIMIRADVAMYYAKFSGKGKFAVFAPQMAEDAQRRIQIAAAIVPAADRGELEIHYQPKVDSAGEVCGFEALSRWPNSPLGPISPGEFIPIAEKSGHVHHLSRWLVRQALEDLPKLQDIVGKPVGVSLNLSAHDLRDANFADDFIATSIRRRVSPAHIEVEITETAYLENFDIANNIVKQFRDAGFRVSLDDFGTGYSSLSYLSRINIDTLKIDRQFIAAVGESERDSMLTRTILDMASQLNLRTVAEGVETADQVAFLVENGCDLLQGFYFSAALPLSKINRDLLVDIRRRAGQG